MSISPPSPPQSPDGITLILACFLILGLEISACLFPDSGSPLIRLVFLRLLQCSALIGLLHFRRLSPMNVGLHRQRLISGLLTGLAGCAIMGLLALGSGLALWYCGIPPLNLVRVPLPENSMDLILFFVAGGLIAPLAEELFFRGFLFGYFKRHGWIPALCISTALFALMHPGAQLTQWVGGLAFGLAYGLSGSLAAPFLIHACGNLVLFSLSLFVRLTMP